MSARRPPPSWRLPEGVNPPLWEYLNTPRLAAEEDAYFAGHPLFDADARAVDERFQVPGRLVDLGCGAGRHAVRFASRGFDVAAVDLSQTMLDIARRKAEQAGDRLLAVQANLCDLGCFPDAGFDYALSMFSTLGMIRGRDARRRALREAFRILRPGGRIALHAHNLWLNLRDPQGRKWLLGQARRWIANGGELGDRRMTYRGIPGMEVHLYRWRELTSDLRAAGFVIDEVVPLDEVTAQPISRPRLLPSLRAGGWFVFAHRPSDGA
ncbi:MAG: class I SAM-dependent methyltransferase [Paludisphaera borealis]|uniref:class I SAM-dependent methyltransferase n=1 Tax=Paludisphaera borealis TaxID=1387353 RepID=UPI00283FBA88|nr:class I SAM-dependent methyltransferase [Paludisphaera borealis]MDR3619267.1 class I SAM-dependent methyltransferase [Paludisphaera borealis]